MSDEKNITIKSLDDLMKAERVERGVTANFENLAILVDVSGSMCEYLTDGKTRWESAKAALMHLYEITDLSVCENFLLPFQSNVLDEIKSPESLPLSSGGTCFSSPIAKGLNKNASRMILISDGECSYPEKEIAICQEKSISISTIFIGDSHNTGAALLERIAKETGGIFATVNDTTSLLESLLQLESHAYLQLTHCGSKEKNETDVIEL